MNEKIISLELLEYYDENIKKVIKASNANVVVLDKQEDFPAQGKTTVLYILNNNIYRWNGSEYVILSTGGTGNPEWEEF